MNLKKRIINGLYGQAVADAVGNPFEFRENIDPDMVVWYANDAKSLIISDDTQMALFGFEAIHNLKLYSGLLDDRVRKSFEASYIDWYRTQTEFPNTDAVGLRGFPSMYSVQAPGNTCLNSLYRLQQGKIVQNDSMGCGSIMRLLPLTMFYDKAPYEIDYDHVNELAKITGRLTHKHPDSDKAADWYMNTVFTILCGLAFDPKPAKHISDLGGGWIAPECVDMATWAYCKADSFDDLLALSIAHDGDSDSVAAVAGSMWGLMGLEVPQKYIDKLDSLDSIKYVIDNYINKEE